LDEGFYSTAFSLTIDEFTGKLEELKRGKGSQKKSKVLAIASFTKVQPSKFNRRRHKTPRKIKYLKMKVIDDLEAITINTEVKNSIDSHSTVHTDSYKSYNELPKIIQKHNKYNLKFDYSDKVLPWVHKAITNSKNLLKAIHHCIWPDYLQNSLDEFCRKHNRRYFGSNVFERASVAAVTFTWY